MRWAAVQPATKWPPPEDVRSPLQFAKPRQGCLFRLHVITYLLRIVLVLSLNKIDCHVRRCSRSGAPDEILHTSKGREAA